MDDGDSRIRVYNLFQEELTAIPKSLGGKYYDVTGIYYANKDGGTVIDELERTKDVVEVAAPAAISSACLEDLDAATPAVVYTIDGRLAARTNVGSLNTLPLRHGLYIVKTDAATWRISH